MRNLPQIDRESTFFRGRGGRVDTLQPTEQVAEGGHAPLLYLNDHNSDEIEEEKPLKGSKREGKNLTSKTAKKCKSITANTAYFVKKFGIENVAFGTITFKKNIECTKEAQRRYNNFLTVVNRNKKFKVLMKVLEFQKRGACHYHLLIRTTEPIRKDFDFKTFNKASECKGDERDKYTKIYAKSATSHLRHLWGYMRTRAKAHGFGRTEIMPIEYPNNVGSYLGKYVCKDLGEKGRGARKISYAKNLTKVASPQFSWINGPGGEWRKNLKAWAEYRGFRDTDHIAEFYGPRWSYHLYPEIMYDSHKLQRQAEGLPEYPPMPHGRPSLPPRNDNSQDDWSLYFSRQTKKLSSLRKEGERLQLYRSRKAADKYRTDQAWIHD